MIFSCYSSSLWAWNLGFGLGVALTLQTLTGLMLTVHFELDSPCVSIERNNLDTSWFWLIKISHSSAASLYFILLYAHIMRALLNDGPTSSAMRSGWLLFLGSITVALTGYILCFGNMAFWAVTVITTLVKSLPGCEKLAYLILGGQDVSLAIVPRAMTLHFLGGLLMWLLCSFHLHIVHIEEATSDLKLRPSASGQPFLASGAPKDLLVLACLTLALADSTNLEAALRIMIDDSQAVAHPNPLSTPEPICPEWYVLGLYCCLKFTTAPVLLASGVVLGFTLSTALRKSSTLFILAYILLSLNALSSHKASYSMKALCPLMLIGASKSNLR